MGLDKKILMYTCLLMTVMLFISGTISNTMSGKVIAEESNSKIVNALSASAAEFDLWITRQEDNIQSAGSIIAATDANDDDVHRIMISTVEKSNGTAFAAYMAYPDKRVIFHDDTQLPPDFDVTVRSWYVAAVEAKGEPVCTTPYIDYLSGKMVITVSCAIYKNDTLFGVAGADINIEDLVEKCNSIELYENAYPFLMDNEGNILAHRNEEYLPYIEGENGIFTNISDVEAYSSSEPPVNTVRILKDYDGVKRAISAVNLSTTNWLLGYAIDYSTYNKGISEIRLASVIVLVPAVIAVILLGSLTLKLVLVKPMKELKAASEEMANGNLSYYPTYEKMTLWASFAGVFMQQITR